MGRGHLKSLFGAEAGAKLGARKKKNVSWFSKWFYLSFNKCAKICLTDAGAILLIGQDQYLFKECSVGGYWSIYFYKLCTNWWLFFTVYFFSCADRERNNSAMQTLRRQMNLEQDVLYLFYLCYPPAFAPTAATGGSRRSSRIIASGSPATSPQVCT